ncbi:MAG TPA: hypothetical protein VM554_13795 [Acidisarcina sp.]|nr:hypothetical protein [Acidisarcina sp.]
MTEQETEWNRGDSHLNAISLLFGDGINRQTRSTFLARPRDKEPRFAPHAAVFTFGAAPLKCAQGGRDSVCDTVLKKAVHGRASDPRFHLLDHAATAEETR